VLSRIKAAVQFRALHFAWAPTIRVHRTRGLVRLGSRDCGLTLQPSADLQGSTIISVGVGEDATFDVEFAARFGAKVISVDPTPRAVFHYRELQRRVGQPATRPYARSGPQSMDAYDLSGVSDGQLVLEESALWIENSSLKFYAPPNPNFVSHSISNIQNEYSSDTPHIVVPAITPEELFRRHGLREVSLMKFDTEGAELEILPYMLGRGITPRQMLVEYDELFFPSRRSRSKVQPVHDAMEAAGYVCRHYDGWANYLYIRGH